jgi:hypothetical protein
MGEASRQDPARQSRILSVVVRVGFDRAGLRVHSELLHLAVFRGCHIDMAFIVLADFDVRVALPLKVLLYLSIAHRGEG